MSKCLLGIEQPCEECRMCAAEDVIKTEQKEENAIVKVKCMHFWSDWTEIKEIGINLDEYVFFEIDYRGKDSWHIKGHKCDKNYKWTVEEFSEHQVNSIYDVARFIAQANTYAKENQHQQCKVSRFNNLHYSDDFYEDLQVLLELIKKYESELKES